MTTIRDAWRSLTAPKDRRPIWEWASTEIELAAVLTIKGKFNPDISRHFIGPWESLQDDRVRQVVVRKPTRGGGTLISDIWHAWCRANDPGPAMAIMQSEEIAKEHAEARFMPQLLSCPSIRSLLPADRHKLRSTEIIFNDGLPIYVSGPGINKLQTKGIRYISGDEVWLWDSGILEEAKARLGDFARIETSKLLLVSQAGIEDDDFDRAWREGHCAIWNVDCMGCGKPMPLRWSMQRADGSLAGMRWDQHKDEHGIHIVSKSIESVRYECPSCGHPHMDNARTKSAWNRTGRYISTNEGAPISKRSFHWPAWIADKWQALVEDFLNACNAHRMGLTDPLIAFFQKRAAEPKSEATISESLSEFKRVSYEVNSSWKDEAIRFMTVDRQEEDLYWVTIRAWSTAGESRRLWFGKCFGSSELEQKATEFKCSNVFVDSGFKPKGDNGVYQICARNDWVALKGEDTPFFWHSTKRGRVQRSYSELTFGDPESGTTLQGKLKAKLIRFASSTMADRLTQLINSGRWTEPADDQDKEYRKQMSSEFKKVKVNKFTGKREWVWVCPSGNNHAFDCSKMQVLAATLAGVVPDIDFNPATDPPVDAANPAEDRKPDGHTPEPAGHPSQQPQSDTR